MRAEHVAARRRAPLLFPSLAGYRLSWLRGDLIAGLTEWAVLVPEPLAEASMSAPTWRATVSSW